MSHEIIVILVCLGFFGLMIMISDLMTLKMVSEISDIFFKSQIDLQEQIDMIKAEKKENENE